MVSFEPIGVVRNGIEKMSTGNWATVESVIELGPEWVSGLAGLAEFSHLVVVFHLHRIPAFDRETQLLRRPRGMEHLDAVGVFSQRTKFRPNPIGVTPVRLVKIDANRLVVTGLDAMDGSPVFDIKPFIPEFDSVGEVRQPSWVSAMVKGYF